jgi:glycosyltransferase involved in cell wall biosynthesis
MTPLTSPRPVAPVAPDCRDAGEGGIIECDAHAVRARPLHIALALSGTDLGRSGIGTYVREVLPPLLARATNAGGTVTAFGTSADLAAYDGALGAARRYRLRSVPQRAALNALWHLRRADAFARRIGADVLLLPAANRRITSGDRVPTVAVVHDLAQLRVSEKYDALRMYYFRRVLLPAFRRPTQLIAISNATRDDLVKAISVPAESVRVVYNGVNVARFKALDGTSPAVWNARRATGLHTKPYLLYPARLEHPGKNHVRLLHAFARSRLANTHTLALSGADWGAGELIRNTVRELNLTEAVSFLGFISADALSLLVAGAEAVLMLGLHEGFGLPPLEALCAGRPVCVANTGALPEVVGSLGVQCDPFDEQDIARALQQIVRDADVRNRCQAEGPAWAARFTWATTANGLFEACQDAVEAVR